MKLLLSFSRAPGDVLMLTGLVRDLKLTYGDRHTVGVRTKFPNLWQHNPYITSLSAKDRSVKVVTLGGKKNAADSIGMKLSQKGVGLHYSTVFHRVFSERTGIEVQPLFSKPDLHLSEDEKRLPFIKGRYWVIVPDGKTDMTVKWHYHHHYQEVVDRLRPWGLSFVQEGAKKPIHEHRPLNNVLNLLGQTSIRDMIRNIYHAEGVICGCSLPMHIAGALEKPCVVLFGGREEPAYEAYVNSFPGSFGPKAEPVKVPHRLLHTIGQLDCCRTKGCWRRRVVALPDGMTKYNTQLCKQPDFSDPRQTVPRCMSLISVDHTIEAVMSYYEDHTLPPLW